MSSRRSILFIVLAGISLASAGCGGSGGSSISDLCGSSNQSGPRIIHGAVCPKLEDAIVRIRAGFAAESPASGEAEEPPPRTVCTGFFIDTETVLTAAHCVEAGTLSVGYAGTNLPVSQVIVHPSYTEAPVEGQAQLYSFNDFALLKVPPIAGKTIPIAASVKLTAGTAFRIFGYGDTGFPLADELLAGTMTLAATTQFHLLSAPFTGRESDTCYGDSGGPATVDVEGAIAAIGITTQGTNALCNIGDEAVFANLQSPEALDFIRQNSAAQIL